MTTTIPSPREIRKTVTVVFCDLTGSTALGERLDPESLRSVMSRYFDRMSAVLKAHGGTVEKFIGDAVMAVFGVPIVHEDDALRAVRAAQEMREALAVLNDELDAELAVTLQERIGVNTGSVVTGDPASGQRLVTGDAVNVAARLEQAASPGEVLIGEATFHLVRDAVETEPLDPLALRGRADVIGAYRLLSVNPGVAGHLRRLDSPMVGRESQLELLTDAFETATADAACHLITVQGPAGIGKSRLVKEFEAVVRERATILIARCLPYGEGITYWPVTQIVGLATGISESDPPDRAREALRRALADAPEADVVAAHLAVLLRLDDGPLEAPWAVRRLFEALARRRPLVAVFDDVQWAEPALLDMIEHVADWSRDAPILLVCIARSEFLEIRPGWGSTQSATSIYLEPLTEPQADMLIQNLLGQSSLTADIRKRIRTVSQGNPLFLEEMLSMLLDEGVLVQEDGNWMATVDLEAVHAPPAISALLSARLDRLSGEERVVLEAASVAGEVFERSDIRALVPESMRTNIDRHLGALLRKDLIRPSPSDKGGDLACRFRHILLRDAAYEAVPKAERAALHEAFATHLLATMGEQPSKLDEFTGYHLEHAHRLRTELGQHDERTIWLAGAASRHLAAAGDSAFQRGDMVAAAGLLGRASALLQPSEPDRLLMAWELALALIHTGSLAHAATVLAETIDRAREAGDEIAAAYAESVQWMPDLLGPDVDADAWEESAERLIAFFEGFGDHRGASLAWGQMSEAQSFRARFADAASAHERALQHAIACGDRLLASEHRSSLLFSLVHGPRPFQEALAFARQTLETARSDGDHRLEAGILANLGRCLAYLGRYDEARRACSESQEIWRDLGAPWGALQHAGRIAWLAGDLDGAADALREHCRYMESIGETTFLTGSAWMLARVEIERGNIEQAHGWTGVAERAASNDDIDTQESLQTLRGLLAAERGDPTAEAHFRASVALGDATDSLMRQARARMDLARFLGEGRRGEAVALAQEALDLAESKGATVYVTAARDLLTDLERGA